MGEEQKRIKQRAADNKKGDEEQNRVKQRITNKQKMLGGGKEPLTIKKRTGEIKIRNKELG
jgi:hypothetical protein